jgi:hypothetical protein
MVSDGLDLIVRYDGKDYRLHIPWSVDPEPEFLIKLKDFLSAHKNKTMEIMEALESRLR